MQVRKAVIPAAGLGTRFLPVTKSLPKALLPILDKPMLQYVIEEAVEAGIDQIILVISTGNETLANYFQPDPELEQQLAGAGAIEMADKVREASTLAEISFVIQERPLGLGHAVLTAKEAVGDEPFVVILPDDIIAGKPGVTAQMLEAFQQTGSGVVAVEPVPWEVVHHYGVVDTAPDDGRVRRIRRLVEKPPRKNAPSNLAVVGRYILPPEIFPCLERTQPDAKGEIQLTDGISLSLENQDIYAYEFIGRRYDCGTAMGILQASLEFALSREDTRSAVTKLLSNLPTYLEP